MTAQAVRVALGELRYVSLTALALGTGRRREFYAAHWSQIPGAETYPSGHRRAPIKCVELWQQRHNQAECPVCGHTNAGVAAPASVAG